MSIRKEFAPFVNELMAASTGPGLESVSHDSAPLADRALDALRARHVFHGADPAELLDEEQRRYIVTGNGSGRAPGPAARTDLESIDAHLGGLVLRRFDDLGAKVLAMTRLEAATLRERFGGLAMEVDVRHVLPRTPLLAPLESAVVPAGQASPIVVRVRAGDAPVVNAIVTMIAAHGDRDGYSGLTDAAGEVRFDVRPGDETFARVVVEPHSRYWSRVLTGVAARPVLDIALTALPSSGFDWGHRAVGAVALGMARGRGVRVGVLDTGIARHPSLRVAGGRNLVHGERDDAWDDDQEGHGTHCAGILAALTVPASTWGYAPDVELLALRVIGADGSGYASDIAAAIQVAVDELGCDVLSMSFVAGEPSPFLRAAIDRALEKGVICVAAAGNDGGPVRYPAAFPGVVAVSAVGMRGTYPIDSVHRGAESPATAAGYYAAVFSNRGPEIAFAGPGVAITSTVPVQDFAAWDGTSMACPHVAGVVALACGDMPPGPRSPARSALILDRLRQSVLDLGLPRDQQGAGLPQIAPLLSAPAVTASAGAPPP